VGMQFAAGRSVLGRLPSEVFQVDVVGDMVKKFQERAEWCSHLRDSGSRVCDLILGPTDDRVCLTIRLEEAAGQL
jgi:hypothetical protein